MLPRIIPRSISHCKPTSCSSSLSLPSFLLPYQHHSFSTSCYLSASPKPSTSTATSKSSKQSHITPSEAESKRVEEMDTLPPPPSLSRPLGVSNPPSTRPQTRAEWRADLLNQTTRLTERKHL